MLNNNTRIVSVVVLVLMAALDSLAQQDVLDPVLAELIRQVVVYALPLLGLGALVDVISVERRRRDPEVPALPDDVRHE